MPLPAQEYFVYADSMKNPAGYKIYVGTDGKRRIKMPPNAAKYWLDQNAIGLADKDSLPEDTQAVLKQMHRG